MKAYVIVTGSIFALITVAHIVRMIYEPHRAQEVIYVLLTAVAGVLSLWALRLVWPHPRK